MTVTVTVTVSDKRAAELAAHARERSRVNAETTPCLMCSIRAAKRLGMNKTKRSNTKQYITDASSDGW